jgi:hypothetical protein
LDNVELEVSTVAIELYKNAVEKSATIKNMYRKVCKKGSGEHLIFSNDK